MLRIIITILLTFSANVIFAQSQITRSIILDGDTIPHVRLQEVIVKGRTKNSGFYRRYYEKQSRLEYNIRKVYPFAKMAANKIQEIDKKLAQAPKNADRKAIIKKEYAELMKTFKTPLSKLSINQGRILVRLIYRETNHTSFSHIQEYKGSFNAYFWQSLALLFGNNLKAEYNPYGSDREIEEIVQKIEQEAL